MKQFFYNIIFLILLSFYSTAQVTINQIDSKGLKQGKWIKTNPETGRIIYIGQFKDNKPSDIFKYYYTEVDTVKSIIEFKNNGKIAYAKIFQMNGNLQAVGKYINEKRDSTWNFYNEKGKLISFENYKNGLKEGKAVTYYPSGAILEEGNYKNDKKHGLFREYFDTKQIKNELTYIEGKPVGKNVFYHTNGAISTIGYHNENGEKYGVWLTKDKDGKVIEKEVYDNGKFLQGKEAEDWLQKNKDKKSN